MRKRLETEREERQRDIEAQEYIEKEKLQHFDVTKHIRFVPPFNANEIDKYFLLIEKVAKSVHFLMLSISKISGRFFCKFGMVSPKYTIQYKYNIYPI